MLGFHFGNKNNINGCSGEEDLGGESGGHEAKMQTMSEEGA